MEWIRICQQKKITGGEKEKKKNNKIKNKIIIDNLSFYTCCGALRTRFAKYFCNTQPQSEKSASPIQPQV
jgi:hypothetical protein